METTKLDSDACYSVLGWPGVAFFINGYPKRWEPFTSLVECYEDYCACHQGEDYLHEVEANDGEWVEQDETCGLVMVVMVGDDRKIMVSTSDLTKLSEGDYCGGCGQIGCSHG
jgi:hypothetical protein